MRKTIINIISIILLTATATAIGQVRSGAAFLKMLPGARLQAMANTATALIDDPHALYANPAATAFVRPWQWSAGYTKWIADIYNASFMYGRQIRTPWSQNTGIAFGWLYQGVPAFDSSDDHAPVASIGDMVTSLSLGQKLHFLPGHFSAGTTLKYYQSTLAQYVAHSFIVDAGVTARTPFVQLGNDLSGTMTFGGSVTQLGQELRFERVGTPLPLTWRLGTGLYLGNHKNFQFLLTADFVNVRDEESFLSFGTEINVSRLFSLQMGYNFGSELMKKFSIGAGINLEDVRASIGEAFPGKGNSFRLDLATMDNSNMFSRTYRGTTTHHRSAPSNFQLLAPQSKTKLDETPVTLQWQKSFDPDLFDQVYYVVVVDKDSSFIADLIEKGQRDINSFLSKMNNQPHLESTITQETHYSVSNLSSGTYHWIVAAVDRDDHIVFAETNGKLINHFDISQPDLEISSLFFKPYELVTKDDFQGTICVEVKNNGHETIRDVKVKLIDRVVKDNDTASSKHTMMNFEDKLRPGRTTTFYFKWKTEIAGKHKISAFLKPIENEPNLNNNVMAKHFYTIPKGTFSTTDTTLIALSSAHLLPQPILTTIYFDENSSELAETYKDDHETKKSFLVLAERLEEHPQLDVQLIGYWCSEAGESKKLGRQRALAVRDYFTNQGVDAGQINLHTTTSRAGANNLSGAPVSDNCRVKITASSHAQKILFEPMHYYNTDLLESHILFLADVKSPLTLTQSKIVCKTDDIVNEKPLHTSSNEINGKHIWQPDFDRIDQWKNTTALYYLAIKDSLGREFKTLTKKVYLKEKLVVREKDIYSCRSHWGL